VLVAVLVNVVYKVKLVVAVTGMVAVLVIVSVVAWVLVSATVSMIDVVTVEYAVLVTVIVCLETVAPTPTPITRPAMSATKIKITGYFMMLERMIHGIKILSVDSAVRAGPGPPRLDGPIMGEK